MQSKVKLQKWRFQPINASFQKKLQSQITTNKCDLLGILGNIKIDNPNLSNKQGASL